MPIELDFSLFQAPAADAAGYSQSSLNRRVQCCVKRTDVAHAFRLGVGDYLRVECDACGTDNFLGASDRESEPCRQCDAEVSFPPVPDDDVYVSLEALHDGAATITKDTEVGMVSWEHALNGETHGAPDIPRHTGVEIVEPDEGWPRARVDSEDLWDLLQVPNFVTWQTERWLFDEGRPMTFLGAWEPEAFDRHAPDGDGRAFLADMLDYRDIDEVWRGLQSDSSLTAYVFRSLTREKFRAYCDMG